MSAALDYFHLDDVTLIGYSLGGCLAMRAAAHEPSSPTSRRRRRFDRPLRSLAPAAARRRASHAVGLADDSCGSVRQHVVDGAMKRSLVVQWGIRQGMHIRGAACPYALLRHMKLYRTDDVSALVEQDVLLFAGAADHYVPLSSSMTRFVG